MSSPRGGWNSFTGLENHGLSALILALHHSLEPRSSPLPLQRRFQFGDKATQTLVSLLEYTLQTKPGLENGASEATRTTNPSVSNPDQTQTVRAPHLQPSGQAWICSGTRPSSWAARGSRKARHGWIKQARNVSSGYCWLRSGFLQRILPNTAIEKQQWLSTSSSPQILALTAPDFKHWVGMEKAVNRAGATCKRWGIKAKRGEALFPEVSLGLAVPGSSEGAGGPGLQRPRQRCFHFEEVLGGRGGPERAQAQW